MVTGGKCQHIGIVACSAEGAALCYSAICTEGKRSSEPYAHPEVSMHTHSFAEYLKAIDRADWQAVGGLMLSSAHKLSTIGADFLICPDNTIHQALPHIERSSPRPWLHIAEVVTSEAAGRGFACLGLLGTRWLVQSEVYPEKLRSRGIRYLVPSFTEAEECHRIIMEELVFGVFEPQSVDYYQRVIERMKNDGAEAVVLGCTEIPLIIGDHNSALPTLDSTRLLARAAVRRVAGQETVASTSR